MLKFTGLKSFSWAAAGAAARGTSSTGMGIEGVYIHDDGDVIQAGFIDPDTQCYSVDLGGRDNGFPNDCLNVTWRFPDPQVQMVITDPAEINRCASESFTDDLGLYPVEF